MKMLRLLFALGLILLPATGWAIDLPTITLGVENAATPNEVSMAVQILLVLTILSVAPAILLMTTAFVRVVVVLSFIRQAMGTQQMPPNQVIVGLSLFLTFFIMAPVYSVVNERAVQPYLSGEIDQAQALTEAVNPVRDFMYSQTREKDLALLVDIAGNDRPDTIDDVPTTTLIPAFMLSELNRAFQIGFMVYVPFLVIDMVVASVLMSMGMMMLPPPIISLPFKLLLFVLVDGWGLVVGSLVKSFS
ncbi:flagellar type III secretion system pore protein FliP [Desulfuromonas acetoxidans]|uniref:Flagellar biosynthetic protein FliP n=1 Tax=Desulfuromonas acetoxidans (strain DSM 684 / 11070) TaxID=281689 RepID=Q1JZS4_DESA6|nr:flagellar type III secretion system pore protein FliP [Desulfuromonas acetoxidans]EAT15818.1 flagellar biosynthetic protein FliP [Desulfuromonas acetoxidans DSM 684]